MDIRWTDEQAAAITADGDILLAASAGTGKTTTIVGRILWSLGLGVGRVRGESGPIAPCADPCRLDQIAAITFTEKAAHDLQDKLRRELEASPDGAALRWELDRATVGTIHGFAADLLRDHALRLDIDPTFRILDQRESEIQQTEVVRGVIATALRERDPGAVELTKRYGLTGWKMSPGAIGRVREVMRDLRWRSREFDGWSVETGDARYTRTLDMDGLRERARFIGVWGTGADEIARDEGALEMADALYRLGRSSVHEWLNWLERENGRDFDSLILDARRLLTRPDTTTALDAVRRRYRLLIIDEFQDTDRAQWDIASAIMGPGATDAAGAPDPIEPHDASDAPGSGDAPHRPRVMLVGDPKQSIYRFRGADIDVWNAARERFETDGRVLRLSWNFRCEPRLVDYVNRVGATAFGETASALATEAPDSVIEYDELRGAREPTAAAALEWIAVDEARAGEQRAEEARRVAGRLYELIGRALVVDPDDETLRLCRAGDVAILARRHHDLVELEAGLREYGIPFYNSATSGLADQQEILDLVTALRIVENPFDDLAAFAFLRSPFVGLRDEVLVRLSLFDTLARTGRGRPAREPSAPGPGSARTNAPDPVDVGGGDAPLLDRAGRYLASVESDDDGESDDDDRHHGAGPPWFNAPESPHITPIERRALRIGLAAVRAAQGLADRADHAEILEALLTRTGYRYHLHLRDAASETLANIERFLALLEEYRHLSLSDLLGLWDRWGEHDLAVPQARLFSSGDDVVTLSTIHAAKGLEWPVVVLLGTGSALAGTRQFVGQHWGDPALGPVFLPRKDDQGPRTAAALDRRLRQEQAEEARLLYVATTRARDRLLVVGPDAPGKTSFATWLGVELPDARESHEAPEPGNGAAPGRRRNNTRARVDDPTTGTGRQIDAFGLDARPQLELFEEGARTAEPPPPPRDVRMVIRRHRPSLQTSLRPLPVSLSWLADIEPAPWPEGVAPIPLERHRSIGSATERMMFSTNRKLWSLRYEHGVIPPDDFLASGAGVAGLPGRVRGTLIHGILERIRHERELARVLDETIASLDLGDLELSLTAGSGYREALEREIARVVRSPEWRWYLEGRSYRETRFLHRSPDGWVQGAFDLLRLADTTGPKPEQVGLFDAPSEDDARAHLDPWVVDFKTHRIEASEAAEVAAQYHILPGLYRAAASALRPAGADAPPRVRVGLHFTHPNVAIEV
ncbi:MAG: UvrD-helicase domain-containing protein [Gemmatimonadota bacterium]|nr:UvrD-helicase domain-containing protein [Gemmatimonadota bacterium]